MNYITHNTLLCKLLVDKILRYETEALVNASMDEIDEQMNRRQDELESRNIDELITLLEQVMDS